MLDPKLLRTNIDVVLESVKKRGGELEVAHYHELENRRSILQSETQELQNQRNQISKLIGQAKAKGQDASEAMEKVNEVNATLKKNESELSELQASLLDFQLHIPNLLDESVPTGRDETENKEIKKWGVPRTFNFPIKDHVELGESLGQLDLDAAAKLSGARFVVLHSGLARLQRALSQFMIDLHLDKHGYQEVYVPYLVRSEALYGTGQLPKFKDDQFKIAGEWDLTLIPTSEVSVTNLVRDSIVDSSKLPMKFVAQTPCFRSEAGSYGKDMKGMIRQHQFQKVEMVQITNPEHSETAHEEMLQHAEKVLQLLELPYRVVLLCSGDTGFSASKTYDLEVWLPGQQAYREISSVSNCKDFQARRMKARYKTVDGKNELLHTLNGSGLAVGRTLVAVMENYQDESGNIRVPDVLIPYMGGATSI